MGATTDDDDDEIFPFLTRQVLNGAGNRRDAQKSGEIIIARLHLIVATIHSSSAAQIHSGEATIFKNVVNELLQRLCLSTFFAIEQTKLWFGNETGSKN